MINNNCTHVSDPDWPAASLELRIIQPPVEGGYATNTSYYDEFGNCVEIGGKAPLGTTALLPTAELELCARSRG